MKKIVKGFTLIEVIISLAVFAIMSFLVLNAFSVGSRSLDVTYTASRLSGDARIGIERMTRELRSSDYNNVTVPQPNQLQFKVPASTTPDGTITWSDWIQYNLGGVNGQQLLRQDLSSGTSTVIANNLTNLQFIKNANPTTLTINLTVQGSTSYGYSVPVNLSSTVEFRN